MGFKQWATTTVTPTIWYIDPWCQRWLPVVLKWHAFVPDLLADCHPLRMTANDIIVDKELLRFNTIVSMPLNVRHSVSRVQLKCVFKILAVGQVNKKEKEKKTWHERENYNNPFIFVSILWIDWAEMYSAHRLCLYCCFLFVCV